jgi:hypothetical protein
MNAIQINKIIEEFNNNLNAIKISKSEIIQYDLPTLLGSEIKSKRFDIIVKNEKNEIIFVCNFYYGDLDEIQNNIPDKLIVEYDFPYDYFVVSTNEFQFFDIKNLNRIYNDPIMSFVEFLEFIKINQPSLKQKIDFVREDLKLKEFELQKLSEATEIEINTLKKELNIHKDVIFSKFREIDEFKNELNKIHNKIEEDLKFRLQLKLKEVDFLISLSKLDIPVEVYNKIDKRFGVGEENKVREIISINNSYCNHSFSILNNQIYLKRDIYDNYSKGRMDLPEYVLTKTIYYVLDHNNTFNQVDINPENFIGWVIFK